MWVSSPMIFAKYTLSQNHRRNQRIIIEWHVINEFEYHPTTIDIWKWTIVIVVIETSIGINKVKMISSESLKIQPTNMNNFVCLQTVEVTTIRIQSTPKLIKLWMVKQFCRARASNEIYDWISFYFIFVDSDIFVVLL